MPKKPTERKPFKGNLYRETTYLHADEVAAVEEAAKRERTSKAEILRRCVRAYFGIED